MFPQVRLVFLSSVAGGLTEYRNTAAEAIGYLDDWKCVRMEEFGARDEVSAESCRAQIERCEVFVGILGPWYGSSFPGSEMSYSEAEYEMAKDLGMTRLMFLSVDNFPITADLIPPESTSASRKHFVTGSHLSGNVRISSPLFNSH